MDGLSWRRKDRRIGLLQEPAFWLLLWAWTWVFFVLQEHVLLLPPFSVCGGSSSTRNIEREVVGGEWRGRETKRSAKFCKMGSGGGSLCSGCLLFMQVPHSSFILLPSFRFRIPTLTLHDTSTRAILWLSLSLSIGMATRGISKLLYQKLWKFDLKFIFKFGSVLLII